MGGKMVYFKAESQWFKLSYCKKKRIPPTLGQWESFQLTYLANLPGDHQHNHCAPANLLSCLRSNPQCTHMIVTIVTRNPIYSRPSIEGIICSLAFEESTWLKGWSLKQSVTHGTSLVMSQCAQTVPFPFGHCAHCILHRFKIPTCHQFINKVYTFCSYIPFI